MPATKDDSIYEKITGRIATQEDIDRAQTFVRKAGGGGYYAAYLQALFNYNQELHSPYDYFFLVGQWALETGYGKTDYWINDGNPAGIGIWKDGVASPWEDRLTGDTSAAVHLIELMVHIPAGPNTPASQTFWHRAYSADKTHIDKVVQLVGDTARWPVVNHIHDLRTPVPPNNFVWAADPLYGIKIAQRMNEIFPGLPVDSQIGNPPEGVGVNIGNRKLRVAIGAGHANTSGGNVYETELNKECTFVLVKALQDDGRFDVRCYTPENGLGHYPGPLDAAAAQVRDWAKKGWVADILHELHHEGTGTPAIRGGFFIYPDSAGLSGRNPGDIDTDIRDAGPRMAELLVAPFGGVLRGTGVMSERNTGVGAEGFRLGVFGAWADEPFISNSFRFISEAATYTNSKDKAFMDRPDYPEKHAAGMIDAYEYIAKQKGNWTYEGGVVVEPEPPPIPADRPEPIPGYPVPSLINGISFFPASNRPLIAAEKINLHKYADINSPILSVAPKGSTLVPEWTVESGGELWVVTKEGYRVLASAFIGATITLPGPTGPTGTTLPSGPAPGPTAVTGPAPPPEGYEPIELEMLRLINQFRRQSRLSELVIDKTLSRAAQWFADDMAEKKYFSYQHIDSQGRRWPVRLSEFGWKSAMAGENIGWGYSPEEMLEGWVNSMAHRDNLANRNFTRIGVGYAPGRGSTGVRKVWVTDFGG